MRRYRSLAERFAAKFIPEPNSGCWLWEAAIIYDRYGEDSYGVIGRDGNSKRTMLAHRASWTIHRGPIENKMDVMHTCDNKLCVNPDHLRVGTRAENNADMIKKGRYRGPRGRVFFKTRSLPLRGSA